MSTPSPYWTAVPASSRLNELVFPGRILSRCLHYEGTSAELPAFVFDIDGVLIRGRVVLEAAKKALWRLYKNEGIVTHCRLRY
jgi:hypothetical protein